MRTPREDWPLDRDEGNNVAIVASLPYELTEAGSTTKLAIALSSGAIYTVNLPLEYDAIAKLTIQYDIYRGLEIFAIGTKGKSFFQRIPTAILCQLVTKPHGPPDLLACRWRRPSSARNCSGMCGTSH